MLATPANKPFDRLGWLFELKYDGFRVLAIRDKTGARLLSRRGNDLASSFPEIVACLMELNAPHLDASVDLVLDGELVVLDDAGKADFERLRRRALLKKKISIEHAAKAHPAALFAFDVLVAAGKDVRKLPLLKRKDLVQDAPVQYVGEQGIPLYDAAASLQLEGIVAKRADAPYKPGRSSDWLKIRTPAGRHAQERRSEDWS
jgi:bifunctional non-homologous end joining protein LigD